MEFNELNIQVFQEFREDLIDPDLLGFGFGTSDDFLDDINHFAFNRSAGVFNDHRNQPAGDDSRNDGLGGLAHLEDGFLNLFQHFGSVRFNLNSDLDDLDQVLIIDGAPVFESLQGCREDFLDLGGLQFDILVFHQGLERL